MGKELRIKLTRSEIAHLIEKAPLNHVLSFDARSGILRTTEGSWEYNEIKALLEMMG